MTKEDVLTINAKIEAYCGGKKWTSREVDLAFNEEMRYWETDRAMRAVKKLFSDSERKTTFKPTLQELKRYYDSLPRVDIDSVPEGFQCGRCTEGYIPYKKKEMSYSPKLDEEFWVWREFVARCSCPLGQRIYGGIKFYDACDLRGAVRCDDLRDYIYGRPTDDTPEFKVLVVQETRREF